MALLVDMELLFLCSTSYLLHSVCSLMRYQVEHNNSISISLQTGSPYGLFAFELLGGGRETGEPLYDLSIYIQILNINY